MNPAAVARYADLVVAVGANVQRGQLVGVNADVEHAPFVRELVRASYAAGARHVDVLYRDAHANRAHLTGAPAEHLGWAPPWRIERLRALVEEEAAFVSVGTETDPDLLADVDPGRVAAGISRELRRASLRISESGAVNWTIVGFPTEGWARKVLGEPDVDRLFDLVARTVRLDEPDPAAAWREHLGRLRERAALLDERAFDAIRYRGPGTDLVVGLVPGGRWLHAGHTTRSGVLSVANMPTEEVFTAPHRERADGRVRSTYPLVLDGVVVTGLELELRGGRIVAARAETGEDVVRAELARDEHAARLGELALVDAGSRVGATGVVFWETLYDENASSHIAWGSGIGEALPELDPDDAAALAAAGVNRSGVHTDFMVGGVEVEIDGLPAGGGAVPLLRGGEWQLR